MNVSDKMEDLILTEGYEQFCLKKRQHYRSLVKMYSLWCKFSCAMSVASIILYGASEDNLFLTVFKAFVIMFFISIFTSEIARRMWKECLNVPRDRNSKLVALDSSECKVFDKDLISYQGKKYQRLGLKAYERDITPGFWMVASSYYFFIVEVMPKKEEEEGVVQW